MCGSLVRSQVSSCCQEPSPSSSPVQDTALSRRRRGFKSPWGRSQDGNLNRNKIARSCLLPAQGCPPHHNDNGSSNPPGDAPKTAPRRQSQSQQNSPLLLQVPCTASEFVERDSSCRVVPMRYTTADREERWLSGRKHCLAKAENGSLFRGFESLPLRLAVCLRTRSSVG